MALSSLTSSLLTQILAAVTSICADLFKFGDEAGSREGKARNIRLYVRLVAFSQSGLQV